MTFDWLPHPESITFSNTWVNAWTANTFGTNTYTLSVRAKGFDTSYWNHGNAGNQKPIDFTQAYAAGYSFWIGRLTRGRELDSWIIEDYQAASKTPLIKCVYHVLFPGEPAGPHIDRLRAGLALLTEPPKAIALDLERGAEFGAAGVTLCLENTVMAIRPWWTGKLLLYTNFNYLRNYILNLYGLDLWIAYPNGEPTSVNWTIWQKSWSQAIPGLPDQTVDLDEFNGDEMQLFAYFNAETEPPQPPEDNLNIKERLQILAEELAEIIADIPDGVPQPPAPPQPPTPPPPAPVNVRKFYVDPEGDKAKANARCIKEWNSAGRPVFAIYPNDSAPTTERQQFNAGEIVQVEGDIWTGDGGLKCYQLYDPQGEYKARPLFIRKDDGYLV